MTNRGRNKCHRPVDILFVGHDASRTGAPRSLLRLIDWFGRNSDSSFGIVLDRGGELLAEYENAATVRLQRRDRHPIVKLVTSATPAQHILRHLRRPRLRAWVQAMKPRILVGNTAAAFPLLLDIGNPDIPAISFVREMPGAIRTVVGCNVFHAGASRCRRLLAVSEAVSDGLVDHGYAKRESVLIVPGCLPIPDSRPDRASQRQKLFDIIRCSDADAALVVGIGSPTFAKGADLFVRLGAQLNGVRSSAPIHCVWIGGIESHSRALDAWRVAAELGGVADRVHFIGPRDDATKLVAGADILALTSREDSCPLVVMEAAVSEVPSACFANSGGAPEFAKDDSGIIAPFEDVDTMAEQIKAVLALQSRLRLLGQNARRRVERCHDINQVGPQLQQLILEYARPSGREQTT
jgi:glycosyltransferase involved in cell wall biosynthesis